MSLEGELRVSLRLRSGTIDGVRIASTRPDIAHTLLQGRTRTEVQAAVPVMFSLCSRSQAAASSMACAAAAGEPTGDDGAAEGQAAVAAETLRELACHTLLHWPRWLGEEPAAQAVAAVRAAMGWSPATATSPAAQDIAWAAFGQPADEWLQVRTGADLKRWATEGRTASARFIRQLIDAPAAGAAADAADTRTAWLPRPDAAWLTELSKALDADPGFARAPVHCGAAAETGSLARLQTDPLFNASTGLAGSRLLARFVARLHELALLLDGRLPLGIGALPLGDGTGLAWVDNARGLLLHRVRLSQGRVSRYDIVAPTEWNFHPRGPLAAALQGAEVESGAAALALGRQVVHSLDPCVACHVELDDA